MTISSPCTGFFMPLKKAGSGIVRMLIFFLEFLKYWVFTKITGDKLKDHIFSAPLFLFSQVYVKFVLNGWQLLLS